MPVHVFLIESVQSSFSSITNEYELATLYLRDRHQLGQRKNQSCADVSAIKTAVGDFVVWSTPLPEDEPKVLWISVHGKEPESTSCVGTSGVSAAYDISNPDPKEIIEWVDIFNSLHGELPKNTVVIFDVCWGASPTAPSRLTRKKGVNPALFFGPCRSAHYFELASATGFVFGLLASGKVPSCADAQRVVASLNAVFPNDAANDKPFYRVWWWDESATIQRYPTG